MEKRQDSNTISSNIEIYFTSLTFKDSSDLISNLIIYEEEVIAKLKINYSDASEIKILKQKFYEKTELYLLTNKKLMNLYGEYLKKLHKTISNLILTLNSNEDYKALWKRIKSFLVQNNTLEPYAKFSVASLKHYLKTKYKQVDNQIQNSFIEIPKILNKIHINKEITLNEFGLEEESIQNVMELIILSNKEHINNNLEEFSNSTIFKCYAALTKSDLSSLDMTQEEIHDKISTLIQTLNKSEYLINVFTISFLTLLFYDLITVTSDATIRENYSDQNFAFSSFNRVILLNMIRTLDDSIYNVNFRHYFSQVLKFISQGENIITECYMKNGKNILTQLQNANNSSIIFKSFNYESVKSLIESSSGSSGLPVVNSFQNLIKDLIVKEKETPVTIMKDVKSQLFGMLRGKAPDIQKTVNSVKSLINNETNNTNEYNLQSMKLEPYSHGVVYPHVYICLSGFTSELDEESISWEKLAEYLGNDSNFYMYKWEAGSQSSVAFDFGRQSLNFYRQMSSKDQNVNKQEIFMNGLQDFKKNNCFMKTRKNAKFYGKILAHIIASRSIFPFQTISLVGFSLGCHVIKSCMKEIYKISLNCRDLRLNDILQNVIFIAGATTFSQPDKWGKYLKFLVKGKIVNCFSQSDMVLKYLYSTTTDKKAIGNNEISFGGNLSNIYNLDFSNMMMDHNEYRDYHHLIARFIKLKINI